MIRFTNVNKIYDNGTHAIKGVSFLVDNGEFVFLVGPSGSGKSTILKLLTAEEPITRGSAVIDGFDLRHIQPSRIPMLRRRVGVVYQDFRLIKNKTVEENLEFAMRVINAPRKTIPERVHYVLDLVGLVEKKGCFPTELSGGEQQRVAIARALINNPSTIVADEPTGNLDPERSLEIMMLLERINQLGTTILVVTHERQLVNQFNKRVITWKRGRSSAIKKTGVTTYDENQRRILHQRGLPRPAQPWLLHLRRHRHHRRLPHHHRQHRPGGSQLKSQPEPAHGGK